MTFSAQRRIETREALEELVTSIRESGFRSARGNKVPPAIPAESEASKANKDAVPEDPRSLRARVEELDRRSEQLSRMEETLRRMMQSVERREDEVRERERLADRTGWRDDFKLDLIRREHELREGEARLEDRERRLEECEALLLEKARQLVALELEVMSGGRDRSSGDRMDWSRH